jgi:ribosomal protein S20
MTRPTGEPTVEELKTFQIAVYEQQSKMMSEWLQQEQHETQFGNYQAFGESHESHASCTSVADGIRGRIEALQQQMLQETSAIQTEATDGLLSTDFAHQKIARMRQFYGHHIQMYQQQAQIEALQQQMLQETSAIQKEATDGLISTDCAHQKVAQMRQFYGHHIQMYQQQLMIQMSPYAAPQHELGREPPVGVGGTSIDKTKEGKGQRNGSFVLSAICVAVAPCPFRRPDLSARFSVYIFVCACVHESAFAEAVSGLCTL